MWLGRRIKRLEDAASFASPAPEDEQERQERRKRIREEAEHANYCEWNRGGELLFEIDENGDVLCTFDGRPVTDSRQILAEAFYHMEVEWGGPGLVHDEEDEAFYTPEGHLALSRYVVNLQHLLSH